MQKNGSGKSRVVIRSIRERDLHEVIRECLDVLDWKSIVGAGAKVVLKPNLSDFKKEKAFAANTDPLVLSSVLSILGERTDDIIVGESDGTRFSVEECFDVTGYDKVLKEHGGRWMNFSKSETRAVDLPEMDGFEFPSAILDCDVFITLPVLKTHALTTFTGALKNQWGCIPRYDRILLHRYLDTLIADLNFLCRPGLAVMDGLWGMEGRGPVNGKPVRLDLILASTDVVALDATAMRLTGLDPSSARHLVYASEKGLGRMNAADIEVDGDFEGLKRAIEPAVLDNAIRLMNYFTRYRFFTYKILLNDSIFTPTKKMVSVLRRYGLV